MPRTHVGLAGCGRWGRNILRDLLSLDCRVTVADPSPDSRRHALDGGAVAAVATAHELPGVDGVVVATLTVDHATVVEAVLPRGVPVFVEKPLTCDVADARRLVDLAADRLYVMHKWRYHPGIQALGEIAASGELGPVHSLRMMHVGWSQPHPDVDAIWILAPHCLSIVQQVLGYLPPPRSAVADPPDERGHSTALVATMGTAPSVSFEVSACSPDKVRHYRLCCRDGVAELRDGYDAHVAVYRSSAAFGAPCPAPELRPVSDEMPLLRELREFVEHLRGGPRPRCTAHEGLAVVEAVAELRTLAGLAT